MYLGVLSIDGGHRITVVVMECFALVLFGTKALKTIKRGNVDWRVSIFNSEASSWKQVGSIGFIEHQVL
ncbi:MAG TPA: hypothetical protein ACQGQH_04490 [Xylella sp.]